MLTIGFYFHFYISLASFINIHQCKFKNEEQWQELSITFEITKQHVRHGTQQQQPEGSLFVLALSYYTAYINKDSEMNILHPPPLPASLGYKNKHLNIHKHAAAD